MADGNITKHVMYGAVAPDDFESMLDLDRYGARSTAFDKIISATHDHFWDPLDKKYIDFDEPFDIENVAMTPEEMNPVLKLPYVAQTLTDPKERIAFINNMQLYSFSSILHGEQGALNLWPASATCCWTRARRNTPPTRPAKKPATSPPSPSTSRPDGGGRWNAARR